MKRDLHAMVARQRFSLFLADTEVILKTHYPLFVLVHTMYFFFKCQRDIAEKIR